MGVLDKGEYEEPKFAQQESAEFMDLMDMTVEDKDL